MKKKIFVPKKKFKSSLVDRLIKSKFNFEIIKTLATKTIKYGEIEIMISESKIDNKYLNLFGQVKKEVKKNIEGREIIEIDKSSINYFDFKKLQREPEEGEVIEFKNVVNYDINKAYYNAAKNLNFISNEFYLKCLDLPKEIRLMLIGSIATRKTKNSYSEGILKSTEIIEDKELRKVWFLICNEVDKCLLELRQELYTDYLFFWTDGIFFIDNKINELYVKNISKKHNFEFKKIVLDSFKITKKDGLIIYQAEKEGEKKHFFYPSSNKVNRIKEDIKTFVNLPREEKIEVRRETLEFYDIWNNNENPPF